MSWQSKMYGLGNSLFDLDEIANIASQYPSDTQTNPIGTYGVGVQSDAKHQAASARASDMFYDMLKWNPIVPRMIRGPIADTLSIAGGAGVELVGSLFDYAKSGFKDKNYLTAAKEDIISDWKGTFGTPYGTSTADIMNNVYKQNNYAPKLNSNIFNQGQIEVNSFANRHNQLPVGYNDQQASPAIVNYNNTGTNIPANAYPVSTPVQPTHPRITAMNKLAAEQAASQQQAQVRQQQILSDQNRMQQRQVTQQAVRPKPVSSQAIKSRSVLRPPRGSSSPPSSRRINWGGR